MWSWSPRWPTTSWSAARRSARSTWPWLGGAHERGELLLAGALPDPYDRALPIWTAPPDIVQRFAEQDPYVVHGLVTAWTVRPWNVVIG
jgi:uncharacterized protein YciI